MASDSSYFFMEFGDLNTLHCRWHALPSIYDGWQVSSHFAITTTMTTSIDQFIESFLTAVDFQEVVEVTPDTVLKELPDSLAALGVIVMFDVDFGKPITGDDLKHCTTLTDLYKLLG
jgi:acyl carrier protein